MAFSLSKMENSPWKAVNQLISKYEEYTSRVTKIVLSEVSKMINLRIGKSKEDAPLIFKGKIMYNPKDGKPIKASDWKRLEEAIVKYLHIERDYLKKKMVEDSFYLGTLIQRLEEEQKKIKPLSSFDLLHPDFTKFGYSDYDMDLVQAYEQGCGIYLQNMNDDIRAKIQSIIIEGIKSKKARGEIWQDLWDSEADLNRDWDRVVVSEIAMASNNGLLISERRSTPEEEDVFMIGVSAPDACPICKKLVDGKIVVLLDNPPSEGDKVKVGGEEYVAIWPGKSNYGRKGNNYWTAVTIHPYCRCTWSRWYLEFGKEIKV